MLCRHVGSGVLSYLGPCSCDDSDQVDALTQFAEYMRRLQGVYLDTDPETGRRRGNYRKERPRPEDRMRF